MLLTAFPPRPHQTIARDDVIETLRTQDRALYVSACGTGKTKALQYIASARGDRLVVAFFPSLQLADQTVTDWRQQYEGRWEQPVVVCSDDSVGQVADAESIEDMRAQGAFVTSDPRELAERLREHERSDSGLPLVVFATYQSASKVAAAQEQSGIWFDLAILDEAHRAAPGNFMGQFVLDADSILARKRISATATPRVFHLARRKKETELAHDLDMVTSEAYGPIAHEFGLRDAIDAGVLVDYRIHILQLSREDVAGALGDSALAADLDPGDENVRMAMGIVALERAQHELGVTRTIAYLNSRARAREFVETARTLAVQDRANVITGDMPASDRLPLLRSLADEGGVLANVRCLTEGVDIPRLDAVLFVDPRSEKVDIVQGVGRVGRRHDASGKELGHVILPILEAPTGTDDVDWLNNSAFGRTWDVLTQMAMNDTKLYTQLRQHAAEVATVAGETGEEAPQPHEDEPHPHEDGDDDVNPGDDGDDVSPGNGNDMGPGFGDSGEDDVEPDENILVTHLAETSFDVVAMAKLIRHRIALRTLSLIEPDYDWERNANAVGVFYRRTGRWPSTMATDAEERRLGIWLSKQRHAKKKGSTRWTPERQSHLDAVAPGWDESTNDVWNRTAEECGVFYRRTGRWPSQVATDAEERRLAQWLSKQRQSKSKKNGSNRWTPERQAHLDAVAPGWDENPNDMWNRTAEECGVFYRRTGRWPSTMATDAEERRLGIWLSQQRHAKKNGSNRWTPERQAHLDAVAPGWDESTNDVWNRTAEEVGDFYRKAGRWPNMKATDIEERRLGRWLGTQRQSKSKKNGSNRWTPERQSHLDAVAPGWDESTNDVWNRTAEEVGDFYRKAGRWPNMKATDIEERRLGRWLGTQRQAKKNGLTWWTPERQAHLDMTAPGWANA